MALSRLCLMMNSHSEVNTRTRPEQQLVGLQCAQRSAVIRFARLVLNVSAWQSAGARTRDLRLVRTSGGCKSQFTPSTGA